MKNQTIQQLISILLLIFMPDVSPVGQEVGVMILLLGPDLRDKRTTLTMLYLHRLLVFLGVCVPLGSRWKNNLLIDLRR